MNLDKETIKKIIELGRLRFLAGGFFLYLLGVLLAVASNVEFSVDKFLFGYAIMAPAHLALSYSNNYFDIEVDEYGKPNSISGGTKILIENPELKNICKNMAASLMILSLIISVAFIYVYSFQLTFLGFIVFGNLLGLFYTAPPLRLAYNGFGEIANMMTTGILMPGIGYWVISGGFDTLFYLFAIPFLLYGIDFIITVETPDMEGDRKGGKNTLVVKIGRNKSYIILLISLVAATLSFLVFALYGFDYIINFYVLTALSLIPLLVAIKGYLNKPLNKKNATKAATANLMTFSMFVILVDIFLIVTIAFFS